MALVGAYLAAGGSSYTPAKVQDPCKPRPWRNPQGIQAIAEQFSLSALDGAACRLGVSREALARALATPAARERFTRRYGISDAKLAAAIRAGLVRAVDDAERAGALSPFIAEPLRAGGPPDPAGPGDRADPGRPLAARQRPDLPRPGAGPAPAVPSLAAPQSIDSEAAGAGQPADPGAELGGRRVEGAGELDDRAQARLAPAALEQRDLGPVQLAAEAELLLGDAALLDAPCAG